MNYVGVTNEIQPRRSTHLRQITEIVHGIRKKKECITCKIPGHRKIAEYWAKKISKKHFHSEFIVTLIDIFDDPYVAGKCEERNIKKETKGGFNLNVQKKSKYVTSQKFKIMHPIRKKSKSEKGILLYQAMTWKFFTYNQ